MRPSGLDYPPGLSHLRPRYGCKGEEARIQGSPRSRRYFHVDLKNKVMTTKSTQVGRETETVQRFCGRNVKFLLCGGGLGGLAIIILVSLGMYLLKNGNGVHTFRGFVAMSPAYHQKVAEACEQLYRVSPETNVISTFRPSDADVPATLKALNPEKMLVSYDRVTVIIGGSFGGYGITWRLLDRDSNHDTWVLEANPGGPSVMLVKGAASLTLPRRPPP